MASNPWFKMYATDFLTDTNAWDVVEVGIYIRLLCTQWVNGGLPHEEVRLARICGVDVATFSGAWRGCVAAKFIQGTDGMLRNVKMEEVRMNGAAYTLSKQIAGRSGGKMSGESRKQKRSRNEAETKQTESKSEAETKQSGSRNEANGEAVVKQIESITEANNIAKAIANTKQLVEQNESKREAFISEYEYDNDNKHNTLLEGGAGGNFAAGLEMLAIEECKRRFMTGNECGAGRDVLLKRIMDGYQLDKTNAEVKLWKLVDEFNEHLLLKMQTNKQLADWSSYLSNWANIKIQKDASSSTKPNTGRTNIGSSDKLTVGANRGFFDRIKS